MNIDEKIMERILDIIEESAFIKQQYKANALREVLSDLLRSWEQAETQYLGKNCGVHNVY